VVLLGTVLLSTPLRAAEGKPEPNNSALSADLFYEMLVGEMSAQSGDSSAAYALMLDAARKSGSGRLYQRAVELALGARSGEAALEAARAWSTAQPASLEANRFLLQILIGLNRIADTQEPLKRHLALLTPPERNVAITLLPRYFVRATDRKLVVSTMEQALAQELKSIATGPSAWTALGVLRLQSGDTDGAMEAVHRASALNPRADEPMFLALSLMSSKVVGAEPIVVQFLRDKAKPELRLTYVRNLLDAQRSAEAYKQVQILTKEWPTFPDGWLVQGSLEFQNRELALAEMSLLSYVALHPGTDALPPDHEMGRGLVQAYLLLSQIAEQTLRLDDAQKYLQRIDSPKDALRVASRQAAILAREGKLEQARELLRNVPELQTEDERAKISAEVQLLRDNREFNAAYELLAQAMERFPQDGDLMYDRAMMAEKIGKTSEMEQLLRDLIVLRPDYHHAYNALGYSLAERNVRLIEARQLVAKALELAPDDPFIVDSLAWVEFRSGNAAEALRLLTSAYRLRPDAEIAAHLGEVFWSMGQREQALNIWQEGAQLNPANETLLETTRRLRGKP
jgi:tetratricopeptide (TPR) repeat protein